MIWIAISDALACSGGLWGRQPCHRLRQGPWMFLRHLWRSRHRPPHPHHRQQLHQVLQQAEAMGQERVIGGEGAEETAKTEPELGSN